jgi:hypothetical protein
MLSRKERVIVQHRANRIHLSEFYEQQDESTVQYLLQNKEQASSSLYETQHEQSTREQNKESSERVRMSQQNTKFLTFGGRCVVIYSYNKTNEMHLFLKFIFGTQLYMFRSVSLSIIRSPAQYTLQ